MDAFFEDTGQRISPPTHRQRVANVERQGGVGRIIRGIVELPPSLMTSPHLLGRVLNTLAHSIILADLQGRVVYMNPHAESLLGCQADQVQGQGLAQFFMDDDQEYLYPNLLHLADQGQSFSDELMLRTQAGYNFFALLSMEPVPAREGELPLILVNMADIDKRKRLEKLLGKANYDDLLTIANSIAHELRNPLTGIGGFVNRMYKSCRVSADNDKYYQFIQNDLRRIELLVRKVNDLVALAEPALSEESMGELVDDALRQRSPEISRRRLQVQIQVEELRLSLDRQQILRGLDILIDNALEFTSQGGSIFIQCHKQDNRCRLTFRDTGKGIAPQDLPFIFNPFFSTKANGLGLDLPVLKRIILAHGGTVQAQSEPGQGATFLLELPLERRRAIRTTRFAADRAGAAPS